MSEINDGSRTIEYEISDKFITGISDIEQTEESETSGGINELTFTFSNGETATLTVRNGEAGGFPVPVEYAADMIEQDKIYLYLGSEEGYETGYLYAFLNGQWTNTTLYGVGQDGYSPEVTVSEVEGGVEVRISDQSGITTATVYNGTATDEQVADWLDNHPEATTTVEDGSVTVAKLAADTLTLINSGAISNALKTALLTIAQKVAYIDEHGQTYYQALYDALYPPANLVSISAVFTQGAAVIYDTDSLDDLKQYLAVTALYDDSSTADVTSQCLLSGTLTVGTSIITASYGGMTDTFTVTVTEDLPDYLYNWDLTSSLVDTVSSQTIVLSGASWGYPTQDSTGLHFTGGGQIASLGVIDLIGKTIEFDVAEFDFKASVGNNTRFLVTTNDSKNLPIGPITHRKGLGWSAYGFYDNIDSHTASSFRLWSATGWGNLYPGDNSQINAFDGKTVKLIFVDDNTVSMYLDSDFIGTISGVYFNGTRCEVVQIGGLDGTPNAGDQCYDMTITGIRIYANE